MSLDGEGGGREGGREGGGGWGRVGGREAGREGRGGREVGVTDCYTYSNIIKYHHSMYKYQ